MEVYVLASGSKGNMTYLKVGHIKMFIDAGISYRKVQEKMNHYQEMITDVDTILITHEHHDHVMGLKTLLKQGFIKHVYLTKGTYAGLPEDVKALLPNKNIIKSEVSFFIENIKITPFAISHDANEPVGYVLEEEKKLVVLYDTGYVDQAYYHLLENADIYLLEANHQPNMLMQSPRPFALKKRILSEKGHLSNEDAAWLMNAFTKRKNAIWIVSHISEDCNSILAIEEAIIEVFEDPTKIDVYYASQEELPVIKV